MVGQLLQSRAVGVYPVQIRDVATVVTLVQRIGGEDDPLRRDG